MNRLRVGVLAGVFVVAAVAVGGAGAGGSTPFGAAKPAASPLVNRFIVVMKPGVGVSALSPTVQAAGGHIAAVDPARRTSRSCPARRRASGRHCRPTRTSRLSRAIGIEHLVEPIGSPEFYSGAAGSKYQLNFKGKLGTQAFVPPSDPATTDTCTNYGFSPCMQWDLGSRRRPGCLERHRRWRLGGRARRRR